MGRVLGPYFYRLPAHHRNFPEQEIKDTNTTGQLIIPMPSRQVIHLESHPKGEPKTSDFKQVSEDLPESVESGKVRVKVEHLSVDPYLRAKMSGKTDSYFVPFSLQAPINSFGVGTVVASSVDDFKEGDRVTGGLDWATMCDVKPSEAMLRKLSEGEDAESALSVCGLTGLTAYLGLLNVGRLEEKKKGATVLVSGAAGATGNVVGQIAKLKGYRVVGIAGSDEKLAWLKELGFDEGINYKTEDMAEALKKTCPDGVDLYFDNVGGDIFDQVIAKMSRFGVIVNCGAISTYNATESLKGPRVEWHMISKSLRMQGFICFDFINEIPAASKELASWVVEGKLQGKTTVFDATSSLDKVPEAFIDMMSGGNTGKSIVKVQ